MNIKTIGIALSLGIFLGWSARYMLTPWNIREQASLFAWGDA